MRDSDLVTLESDLVTLEAELSTDSAAREIAKAVSARHAIARRYVMWVRRRNPQASPAEIIQLLERQYGAAITTAGAVISASVIAIDIGIAMIPIAGPAAAGAKSAGQQAAKRTGKEAAKLAAKAVALSAAKGGATRVAGLVPAGDEQLQFEITAVFALALAEIHGMDLDQNQAHALVYGLSNDRVSQKQIATMATDLATVSSGGVVDIGRKVAADRANWSNWANTLADALPYGAAQGLVRTIQTGQLDTVRDSLSGKQQAAVEYGVGAVAGGITRFVFGRDVIAASREAFAAPPEAFPARLTIPTKSTSDVDESEEEPNRALAALEEAAKTTGGWVVGTAGKATRPFRSVDLDGDGIPDEAQALTAVKSIGGSISGAAGKAGSTVAGLFAPKKRIDSGAQAAEGEGTTQTAD